MQTMNKVHWLILLIILGAISGFAQKKDALLVFGKDFSFWVVEPKGWVCHTEDAYRYQLNAYFCLGKKTFNKSPVVMHISVHSRGGNTLQQKLDSDIEDYKKQHKKLELQEFPIGELAYEFLSKKYIYDEKTIDYVCFLDPHKDSPLFLVFVLNGPKEESPKYEKDFLALIKSFFWQGGDVKVIKE
jgi:hypothetical protein